MLPYSSQLKAVAVALTIIFMIAMLMANIDVVSAQTNVAESSNRIVISSGSIKQDTSTINTSKFLHTNGRNIEDSDGNIIILKGANFEGYEYGAFDTHSEADYAVMASWGFNVVRLPIAWQYIEPMPGTYDPSYIQIINRDIAWANKHNIYVVLDLHQWRWSAHFGGEGMPVWLVSGYPRSDEGKTQSINDFWLGKGPNGTVASQSNPSMQDRYVAVWRFLADQFVSQSGVAVYDVFNEPYEGTLTPELSQGTYIYPFYDKLISEIRSVDPQHIVIYEPTGGWDMGNAVLLQHENLVISPHFYKFGLGSNYGAENFRELEDLLRSLNPQVTSNWDIPIWFGEFGTYYNANNSTLWIRDTLALFNKYNVGWAYWTYGKYDSDPTTLFYSNGTERIQLTSQLKQR